MHRVVNPLTPGLSLSTFKDAHVLMEISPSDIEVGNTVVLVDGDGQIVKVNGYDILQVTGVGKGETPDEPEVALEVIPMVPHRVQTACPEAPFTPPALKAQSVTTLKFLAMEMKGNQETPEVENPEETPEAVVEGSEDTSAPSTPVGPAIVTDKFKGEGTQYRIALVGKEPLVEVYDPKPYDLVRFDSKSKEDVRIPVQVLNFSIEDADDPRGLKNITITVLADQFLVPYLEELTRHGDLFFNVYA